MFAYLLSGLYKHTSEMDKGPFRNIELIPLIAHDQSTEATEPTNNSIL